MPVGRYLPYAGTVQTLKYLERRVTRRACECSEGKEELTAFVRSNYSPCCGHLAASR